MLVGWSYGAFVICDYVRAHGEDRIAAINFVEGVVKLGEAAFGTLIGPGFLDHFAGATADDLPTNIATMRSFVRACLANRCRRPTSRPRCAGTSSCRRAVRANLAAREIDDDDVLRTLTVPVLVTHGRADTVVLPAMAEHILATCPIAEASWYDGVGHVPHLEDARALQPGARRAHHDASARDHRPQAMNEQTTASPWLLSSRSAGKSQRKLRRLKVAPAHWVAALGVWPPTAGAWR